MIDLETMPQEKAIEYINRVIASHELLLEAAHSAYNATDKFETNRDGEFDLNRSAYHLLLEACVEPDEDWTELDTPVKEMEHDRAVAYLKNALDVHERSVSLAKEIIEFFGPKPAGTGGDAYDLAFEGLVLAGQEDWINERDRRLYGK